MAIKIYALPHLSYFADFDYHFSDHCKFKWVNKLKSYTDTRCYFTLKYEEICAKVSAIFQIDGIMLSTMMADIVLIKYINYKQRNIYFLCDSTLKKEFLKY